MCGQCGCEILVRCCDLDIVKFCSSDCYWVSMVGKGLSEEHKRNIGLGSLGHTMSEESKNKLSILHTGLKHSDATKVKIGDTKRGIPLSAEHIKKVGDGNRGKVRSLMARKNLGDSKRGEKSCWYGKRGEGTPNWRGGTTPLAQQIRTTPEYAEWRLGVLRRDRFTCEFCGSRVDLEVDHFPRKFSLILRENGIKTVEQVPECTELWDLDNGRTLCYHCHRNVAHGDVRYIERLKESENVQFGGERVFLQVAGTVRWKRNKTETFYEVSDNGGVGRILKG